MVQITDNINSISDFRSFLKIILKVKTIEFNVNLSEAHLNLILDFYFNDINDDTYALHINQSETEKNYFKSVATIDNQKTYLKKIGVLKLSGGKLKVSPDFLPPNLKDTSSRLIININYDNRY